MIVNVPDRHYHPYLSDEEKVGANLATRSMQRLFVHTVRCHWGKTSARSDLKGKERDAACQVLKDLLKEVEEINIEWC
jgi:hypothetical protein